MNPGDAARDRGSGDGEWAPSEESRNDVVTSAAARSLHDLLDRPGGAPGDGDPLPILWHWLSFLPRARQSEIGPDGHPITGGFLPPTGGRQRMFAGARVSANGSLRIGDLLNRRSRVTKVTEKNGRSGPLLFVAVEHSIGNGPARLSEINDIVYKGSPSGSSAAAAPASPAAASSVAAPAPELVDREWGSGSTVTIDPTMLFRFSALTYNAHRIHYDRGYATGTEGYPGLVVHGPLQAILLAELAQREFGNRPITGFSFRAMSPAFDGAPLELRGRVARPGGDADGDPAETTIELAAFTAGGRKSMSATATAAREI